MRTRAGDPSVRDGVVAALLGSAFAVGLAATLEVAALVFPGARAAFSTWGPVTTAAALAATLAIGLPSALVVETVATRLGWPRTRATLVGYLLAALLWAGSFTVVWRAVVEASATPLDLRVEIAVMLAGALALWVGARLSERRLPGPAGVLAFAGGALVAVAVASVLLLVA